MISPTKKRNVSRLHQPPDMSLEVWQRELRKQFGGEQTFRIENIGEHPIFSEFRVINLAHGSVYRVAIRGAEPDRNFCSCADFKTNTSAPASTSSSRSRLCCGSAARARSARGLRILSEVVERKAGPFGVLQSLEWPQKADRPRSSPSMPTPRC
jgi:hypothetical protein